MKELIYSGIKYSLILCLLSLLGCFSKREQTEKDLRWFEHRPDTIRYLSPQKEDIKIIDFSKFKNLEELNLEGLRLNKLPKHVTSLKKLKNLDLGYNDLIKLPENFDRLKNLEYLTLSGNKFKKFPEAILHLKKLKILDLRGIEFKWDWLYVLDKLAKIRSLEKLNLMYGHSLKKLQKASIKQLWLSRIYKRIEVEDFKVFSQMPNLEELYIELVKIDKTGLNYLKNLKTLGVARVDIKSLPISELTNLKKLVLAGQHDFDKVPVEISSLVSLEHLYISGSGIKEVSNLKLKKLKKLEIIACSLKEVHDNIIETSALKTINFSYNQLETLPQNIGKLQNLEKLDLSYNDLETIPESIKNLKKLKVLNLTGNEKISEKEKSKIKKLLSENVTVYF